MRILESIHIHVVHVGIRSSKGHLFNVRNSMVLFMLCMYIFVLQMYLIRGAANLKDFADCIYLMITVAATTFNFGFINLKMAKIFRLIDKLENIVSVSKFQTEWNWFLSVE